MRVALVHDWLVERAGSERVLEAIAALYPEAVIHTLLYDRDAMAGSPLVDRRVVTSPLQRLPRWLRRRRGGLLGLMPWAVEQLDVREADLVISSSHAVAKGVLTRADQLHVCYCHTPMRYAWDLYEDSLDDAGLRGVRRLLASAVLHRVRAWDQLTGARPDVMIANSATVAKRIFKHYRREAAVIHPPVELDRFHAGLPRESFYLVLGRLVAYKRVDVLVEAWARGDGPAVPLVIAGDGPERTRLERAAGGLRRSDGGGAGTRGKRITFLGRVTETQAADLLGRCRGLLFAGEEDFGIVPVEAMAAGAPVVAYGRGGGTETVQSGVSGTFFKRRTSDAVAAAVMELERDLKAGRYRPDDVRASVEHYRPERFAAEFRAAVEAAVDGHRV